MIRGAVVGLFHVAAHVAAGVDDGGQVPAELGLDEAQVSHPDVEVPFAGAHDLPGSLGYQTDQIGHGFILSLGNRRTSREGPG